jgi:exoribonuclease-2
VRVKLGAMDLITLDITGTVLERLDTTVDAGSEAVSEEGQDDEDIAGPIAIAMDVNEAIEPTGDNPSS